MSSAPCDKNLKECPADDAGGGEKRQAMTLEPELEVINIKLA